MGARGWMQLEGRFKNLYNAAKEAGATQAQLGALAEEVAPVGSLWARSARGPRYQLRRWEHDLASTRPRPFVVLDATGEGEGRRKAHEKVTARELFHGRWWRVT